MNLVVISHTPHYKKGNSYVGWGPTLRELDKLASLFDRVVHIAPLHSGPAPGSAIAYDSPRIRLQPVPPAGGDHLFDKLRILKCVPTYLVAILNEIQSADVIHVRCPANISLIAIILLAIVRRPGSCWAKYAGNWKPVRREAWSYTLQRWWLNHVLHRGVVTINGEWPHQRRHVHSFLNPCLTDQELADGKASGSGKQLSTPVRLLFVGSLLTQKGVGRVLEVMARLNQQGLTATLDLVGDGPERASFESQAKCLKISPLVRFHGWLPRPSVAPLYAQSHLMVFPTKSEGWPKVLSEAMAYGVVPVTSKVSSIPQYLRRFGVGRFFDPHDVEGLAQAVLWYCSHPNVWKEESENGMRGAELFSYRSYLNSVRQLLNLAVNDRSILAAEYKHSHADV